MEENKSNILADDVKELWIETEDVELIAHITRGDEEVIVKDGYRIRIKFMWFGGKKWPKRKTNTLYIICKNL